VVRVPAAITTSSLALSQVRTAATLSPPHGRALQLTIGLRLINLGLIVHVSLLRQGV
jgi:hypothetical protein